MFQANAFQDDNRADRFSLCWRRKREGAPERCQIVPAPQQILWKRVRQRGALIGGST